MHFCNILNCFDRISYASKLNEMFFFLTPIKLIVWNIQWHIQFLFSVFSLLLQHFSDIYVWMTNLFWSKIINSMFRIYSCKIYYIHTIFYLLFRKLIEHLQETKVIQMPCFKETESKYNFFVSSLSYLTLNLNLWLFNILCF